MGASTERGNTSAIFLLGRAVKQYARLIAPPWLCKKHGKPRMVEEGLFSRSEIRRYNAQGFNIYYCPNYAKDYQSGTLDGTAIDVFDWVFVDYDCKSNRYQDKDAFIEAVGQTGISPTRIVDSGNGIHAYWRVSDLDAMSFLRLGRRFMRLLNTDDAVQKIFQLMRVSGTDNTKVEGEFKPCTEVYSGDAIYTCEELDKALPPITSEDEVYCQTHYDKTYNTDRANLEISDTLPPKFGRLLRDNEEVKTIWSGNSDDRSRDDFRLGHLMFATDFTRDEAVSVLVNSAKALSRAPIHRLGYATNIVDKIWTFEAGAEDASPTVRDILRRGDDVIKGTRFPCSKLVDDTVHGYRLGQVIGIVGGSGVGKTTLTLNMFLWFAAHNPDYHHFFFSLEQPPGEIASRIKTICGDNDALYDKIHIVSNYKEDGTYNHFSIDSVEDHLLDFQKRTGLKVGATVIDHIGVLDKKTDNGENDGLIGVCRKMKALAIKVNTMLIMLSQVPREKAGIGDLEIGKDAAYGTVFFESFCDYCLCLWQPLKRAYDQGAPTVMALKFAKIRHKKQNEDKIKEDIRYQFYFDSETERLREVTQDEEIAAKHYNSVCVNLRKLDRKTDVVPYQSRRV